MEYSYFEYSCSKKQNNQLSRRRFLSGFALQREFTMTHYMLAIESRFTYQFSSYFNLTKKAPCRQSQQEFRQSLPDDGWVEHDPERYLVVYLAVCRILSQVQGSIAASDSNHRHSQNQR